MTGSLQWLPAKPSQRSPPPSPYATREQTPHQQSLRSSTNAWSTAAPPDVAINKASVIVGYADASWANAAQCASQQGALVMLTTPHCTEVNTRANLIDWRSNKSAQVCRSTLASEAMACDDCVDRSYFANLMVAELLTGEKPSKDLSSWRLNQLQVTDCKSLRDAISAEHPKTSEKRTYVDIRSIQQFIDGKTIRWCPTSVQWADGLTKATKEVRDQFRKWLNQPYTQLVSPESRKKYKDQ